jgi:GNAT superfamily N-acetyltransferase
MLGSHGDKILAVDLLPVSATHLRCYPTEPILTETLGKHGHGAYDSMSGVTVIRALSKAELAADIDHFLAVAQDVPGEYWGAENFLRDAPSKWSLSLAAWSGDVPVGYAVLSRRTPYTAHLHHFMIAWAQRGDGLGARLLAAAIMRCREHGCSLITLKVAIGNQGAQRFYIRHGFSQAGAESGYCLMSRTLA